jgi:DNA polymerase-3 subunit epsilon
MKFKEKFPDFVLSQKGDYLLIDVRTTGLRPDKDRIAEIGLVMIKNGVIHTEWHSHINIKKSSVKSASAAKKKIAPTFSEIAAKLHQLLKNKIIVAHNACFIYEFLKHEMLRSDIVLDEKILCSISLSRLLFPEAKEHHLEAINSRLSLDLIDKSPLSLLLSFFSELKKLITSKDLKNAVKMLTQTSSLNLTVDHKTNIPTGPGIYRFYDENNCLIYIGKSASLGESIYSYFQLNHDSHKKIKLAKQIKKIDWITTFGELGTSLLASQYINKYKPLFNRLVEKNKTLFTIQLTHNGDYLAFKIIKLSDISTAEFPDTFGIFKNKKDATNLINFFINQSNLCYHINNFEKSKALCFRVNVNKCNGACNKLESPEEYNHRVKKIMKTFPKNLWPFTEKIAIKETCAKTNDANYHIIHNWTYIKTVKSLQDLNYSAIENSPMNENIYGIIKNFLHKEENHQYIIEIQ